MWACEKSELSILLQLSSSEASLQSGMLSQRKSLPTHEPSSHRNSSERQPLPLGGERGGGAVVGTIEATRDTQHLKAKHYTETNTKTNKH